MAYKITIMAVKGEELNNLMSRIYLDVGKWVVSPENVLIEEY